ncbi:MAG TPA: DUF2784 domain-containing protein [Pyrinomonadaceae bacterium]|jgi:hypothetical protein|nr:DUF2784 domain-containing protein [Pyrinomonadaceae bacterium]
MIYRILLELAIAAHFAFIVFIIFGAFLALRWRWAIFLHLPALAYGLLNELLNISCPLEPLEFRLRDLSIESGYATGFLEPYLIGLIYVPNWNQALGNFLAASLLLLNLFLYLLVFRSYRRSVSLYHK